jgi:two-component system sensor histidine kinase TctE
MSSTPLSRLRRAKLSHALLALLVPALLVLALIELWFTADDVKRAANAAYDRSLLGALKSIDANVSTDSGGLSIELPYRMFEFFELTASGPVHFRVATADGLVEVGSADLPAPPTALKLGVPQFYDGEYFGEPVRLVAYLRELERPTAQSPAKQVVIQVAESFQSRDEFRRVFVRRAAISNIVFLLLAVGASAFAVMVVLEPLGALSRRIALRPASDLEPLAVDDVPADVRPLIGAMNQHMDRIQQLVAQQRAFLDDASHQLRTHLTTLRMQVDYARVEGDPAQVRTALDALSEELQRATRSTHQLLSLGRSDTAALEVSSFDLLPLLQEVAREFLPAARARALDLGVESAPQPATADRELLREALANLVANAIAYVPQGSVTLSAAQDSLGFSVSVEDNGPGLPPGLAERLGTRFLRAEGSRGSGSGLGLAIAQAIAARHGGVLRLEAPAKGSGLRATLWWPRLREGRTP